MLRYVSRRLMLFLPTLIGASVLIFAVMRIVPGDVALIIVGLGSGESSDPVFENQLDSIRQELGLTDPLPVQYGKWMWSLVNGDFGGRSLVDKEPLASIVQRRLPVTLQLALYTVIITWALAIPLGVIAALHQNRLQDYIVRTISIAGLSVPGFWSALVLLLVMLWWFRWSPPIFYKNLWEDPLGHLLKAIWPALILAWAFSSSVVRVTRSNMLDVVRQDYIRTARSKGLTERIIVLRHALRNALIPVITLGGTELGGLLSGAVILENIFGLPGIGQGIVQAANARDYPVIQTLVVLLVTIMLTLNLIVDMVYSFVDPRIRYS